MPSNYFILCHPLLLPPSIFSSIRVFSNEPVLHIRWPKYWNFSFNISPSNEYSGLISFRMDCLDLLASPRRSDGPGEKIKDNFSKMWKVFRGSTVGCWQRMEEKNQPVGIKGNLTEGKQPLQYPPFCPMTGQAAKHTERRWKVVFLAFLVFSPVAYSELCSFTEKTSSSWGFGSGNRRQIQKLQTQLTSKEISG